MVKKLRQKPSWLCAVCKRSWSTKKDAEICERRKPERTTLYSDGRAMGWAVGRFVIYNGLPAKIVGEAREFHCIRPKIMLWSGKTLVSASYSIMLEKAEVDGLRTLLA